MAKRKPLSQGRTKNSEGKSYQVFLSHATADRWLATTLCEKIEATGATYFRDDRDIQGGDDIPDEIRRQIKRSREMIVLLTPASFKSQWVTLEIGAAWCQREKARITIILYHILVDSVPALTSNKKAFDLNEFDHYLAELTRRVGDHHGKE